MPTLNWIGKDKIINHDKEVPFRLLCKNKKLSLGAGENMIVEGDNLEALKALMPFFYNKVKCIYIDPPYNTGNEKWVYNDNVNSPKIKEWLGKVVGAEGEDLTRHDKWLCMMYPRLKLLRDLLREDGVILISVDDNEHCDLKFIMEEIFGPDNFEFMIWKKIGDGDAGAGRMKLTNRFRIEHEYIFAGYKNKDVVRFNKVKSLPDFKNEYGNPDNDQRGPYKTGNMSKTEEKSISHGKNFYTVTSPSGKKFTRQWHFDQSEFERLNNDKRIYWGKKGDSVPSIKIFIYEERETVPTSIIEGKGSATSANKSIEKIFSNVVFPNTKPVELIKYLLNLMTSGNDIILDSFAGSGTTAQAVLELNKEDGGNRKFVLVELEKEIARKITAERVRRVSKNLNGSFNYMELDGTLFTASQAINPEVKFNDLARYIFFTETNEHGDEKAIKGNFIGESNGIEYYLIFDPSKKSAIDASFLNKIKKSDSRKVVYADKCLLDSDDLSKNKIIFKQIPYEVKVY
jgi:adenine specific DNA methylase Mod